MARGDPLTSPYVATFGDHLADPAADQDPARPGHAVRIQVDFDNTTHAITGAVVWRAGGCRWTHIVCGVGADGTPNSSTFDFDLTGLTDQARTVTANAMGRPPYNVDTIDQFMAAQITAY
jgi:uncharacterized membrane protein